MTRRWLLAVALIGLQACSDEKAPVPGATPSSTTTAPAAGASQPAPYVDAQLVYEHYCLPCHAPGPGHPGTMRLAIRLGAERAVLHKRDDLQPDYVKAVVRRGLGLMPGFRPTEVDAAELDALAAYLARKPGD